jgi:hypothetical protein
VTIGGINLISLSGYFWFKRIQKSSPSGEAEDKSVIEQAKTQYNIEFGKGLKF